MERIATEPRLQPQLEISASNQDNEDRVPSSIIEGKNANSVFFFIKTIKHLIEKLVRLKERVGEGPCPGTRTPGQGVGVTLLGDSIRIPKRCRAIELLLLLLLVLLEENRGGDGLLTNGGVVVEPPLSAGRGTLLRRGLRRRLQLQTSADITHSYRN